uniref:Leucine rich repeat containing 72 n=1 Tax=Nothoprocta perdicaria TaxID=30464 RepID=A0A8C6YQU2_NOTPE
HRLRYLWINNNKVMRYTFKNFLVKNHCLTELYLNNNEVTDISGALKHLCALQILLLHNNQLKHLDKTVEELKGMRSLQTLNVFHNPLAQDPGYRLCVIHFLPSVQLLDRKRKDSLPLFTKNTQLIYICRVYFCRVPLEDPADAVFLRAMTRSVMEFSSVDWNKVSTCQQRRLENKAEEPYEMLTVRFR